MAQDHLGAVAESHGFDGAHEFAQSQAEAGDKRYRDMSFVTAPQDEVLWATWCEVHNGSGEGGVTWQSLQAFASLTGIRLSPGQAQLYVAMSAAFTEASRRRQK